MAKTPEKVEEKVDGTTTKDTASDQAKATAQNAAAASTGGAYSGPTDEEQPKTLAEARAKHAAEDEAVRQAQLKNEQEVAERDAKPKEEAKPSKRTEAEMARGGKK